MACSRVSTCVVMPTWQVSVWHLRQMVQPMATIAIVPKPTRFAPSSTILTTSEPLFMPPSHQISTRSRSPALSSAACASTTPISAGSPTYLSECCRAAPVPPS